jgi:hypothetical protein
LHWCTPFFSFIITTPLTIWASSLSSTQPVLWPNNQLPCHSTCWLQKDHTSTKLLRKNIAPSGDTQQYLLHNNIDRLGAALGSKPLRSTVGPDLDWAVFQSIHV